MGTIGIFMKDHFFELVSLGLFVGSMVFFYESVGQIAERDYVGAILLLGIGFSVITVAKEMARFALAQRDK